MRNFKTDASGCFGKGTSAQMESNPYESPKSEMQPSRTTWWRFNFFSPLILWTLVGGFAGFVLTPVVSSHDPVDVVFARRIPLIVCMILGALFGLAVDVRKRQREVERSHNQHRLVKDIY